MTYPALTHGGGLNVYCWVKDNSLKRLRTIWFWLHDFLQKINYGDNKKDQWLLDVGWEREGWRVEYKGFLGYSNYSV